MRLITVYAILATLLALSISVFATPQKDKERQSKKDYITAKVQYAAKPTKANFDKMIKARKIRAEEMIKYRKERKNKESVQ